MMESKVYNTRARAKAGERQQQQQQQQQRQPIFKNEFQGYRSTKRWVEEAAAQQFQGEALPKADLQRRQSEGAGNGMNNGSLGREESRKKDGRGVHFKQENERSAPKVGGSSGILRKDVFPDSQGAALSPISLNVVATGARQISTSVISGKQSPAASRREISQRQDEVADGRGPVMGSEKDEGEQRRLVWCNAAFEADEDARSCDSRDSLRSNRFSPASCSNLAEKEVSGPARAPSLMERQEDQSPWTSMTCNADPAGTVLPNSSADNNARESPSPSDRAFAGSHIPGTAANPNSPVAPFEIQWYTPMGTASVSLKTGSKGYGGTDERLMDLSQTKRALAETPSFSVSSPGFRGNLNGVSEGGPRVAPTFPADDEKTPRNDQGFYFTETLPSNGKSSAAGKTAKAVPRALTPARSSMPDGNGLKGGAGPNPRGTPNARKSDPRGRQQIGTPQRPSLEDDARVESDLEAEIEQDIEEEISKEIHLLSQRLAALHAKQEARRVAGGGGGGTAEKPKTGRSSCPHTPLRSAPSPCGSDSAHNKRRGRVVAAKFLQSKSDVKHGPQALAAADRNERFNEAPFLGRPNPPRRSLGTPSRLLKRGNKGQQDSRSPHRHTGPEELRGTKPTVEDYGRERADLDSGAKRGTIQAPVPGRNLADEERRDWNQWNDRGAGPVKRQDQQHQQQQQQLQQPASSLSTSSAAVRSNFFPEFERKLDWVKTLRNGPVSVPSHHARGPMMKVPGHALDESFLKQKSERQDIHAWLRENIGEAEGSGEIHPLGSRTDEGPARQDEVKKTTRMADDVDVPPKGGCTPCRSTRQSTPLRNARTPTPNGKSNNARTVPSRYGTPVKATTPSRRKSNDPNTMANPVADACESRKWKSQNSPARAFNAFAKDTKLSLRKASPTTRKGYPGVSGIRDGLAFRGPLKSRSGGTAAIVGTSKRQQPQPQGVRGEGTDVEGPKLEETKITVVAAEYEKFVEDGVRVENRNSNPASGGVYHTPELDNSSRCQGATGPSSLPTRQQSSSAPVQPPKRIFIRCSDLIKDKHSLLVKGKQRHCTGQSVLPSDCQDSDDSVFPRSVPRTDSSEPDENNSRSEVASIVEESSSSGRAAVKTPNLLFSQPREQTMEAQACQSTRTRASSSSGPEKASTPDFDVVYDYDSDDPRDRRKPTAPYLPEDYTLEMMLHYVDTLQREREGLPRIRATAKDVASGIPSPRDSGCIKRKREDDRSAGYYFKTSGNDGRDPQSVFMDNEGLSPNEIEGLDLESFWCLVGELEGTNMIKRP